MSNLIDSLKKDTAAEIAQVEKYLVSLRNFQKVIDPSRKKRKYTKKTTTKPTSKRRKTEFTVPFAAEVISALPTRAVGYMVPETLKVKEYITPSPVAKKKASRTRKKAA